MINWITDSTAYNIEWTTNCTYDIEINYTLEEIKTKGL